MDDEFVDQLQELTGEFEEDGSDPVVYQFKITLDGIKPPIWRRLQTPSDFTLESLSDMIQAVMGWEGGGTCTPLRSTAKFTARRTRPTGTTRLWMNATTDSTTSC